MRICAACTLELPIKCFDNQQWQLGLSQRRCTTCITEERVAQLTAPECWICMEGEAVDSESLRRDCSCRGTDAGFVHLSCLVKYAEEKNQEWDARSPDDREFGAMREPWEVCPNCLQDYQNTLSADIANEFISYVEKEHPHDKQKQIEALSNKLWLLVSMVKSVQQNPMITEAKEVASRVLALIQQMKAETLLLPTRYMQVEALTYNELGLIAIKEGRTDDAAQEAVLHFEKYLELSRAIDFSVGIANAECNIAFVKSTLDRCDDIRRTEDRLKKYRDLYEVRVNKLGVGNTLAINDGMNLAIALWEDKRGIEAERLLTRVAAVSRRVHGPRHKLTEKVESAMQYFQERQVLVLIGVEWKRYQVLQYEVEADEYYVIQGPVAKPRNIQAEERSSVAANNILAIAGTPVILKDDSSHLNGKIADIRSYCAETDSYEIHFEDERLGSCMMKLENIRILINLPEK